jgi:hypothetical protein
MRATFCLYLLEPNLTITGGLVEEAYMRMAQHSWRA